MSRKDPEPLSLPDGGPRVLERSSFGYYILRTQRQRANSIGGVKVKIVFTEKVYSHTNSQSESKIRVVRLYSQPRPRTLVRRDSPWLRWSGMWSSESRLVGPPLSVILNPLKRYNRSHGVSDRKRVRMGSNIWTRRSGSSYRGMSDILFPVEGRPWVSGDPGLEHLETKTPTSKKRENVGYVVDSTHYMTRNRHLI